MKISKKKVAALLASRSKKRTSELIARYKKEIRQSITHAEKDLKYYSEQASYIKERLKNAVKVMKKFDLDKELPEDYGAREDDKLVAVRMAHLQRKLGLTEGDSVQVTDSELALLFY